MKKRLIAIASATTLMAALIPSHASADIPNPLPADSLATVADGAGLSTLLTAATAAGLDTPLADCAAGPFTVFAPTNEAFEALPADLLAAALADPDGLLLEILNYHIVPGIREASDVTAQTALTTAQGGDIAVEGTVLNGSVNIAAADNFACNGVAHVVDAVLIPDLPSIAQIATDGGFTTLLAGVEAAGLASALADCTADPITVFAPTDEAFAALPDGLLNAALGDPEGLLTSILNYHIVPGYVGSAEVVASDSLTTALGSDISVAGTVLNGSVNITATDNWGCNGVVHVIDSVLVPELPSLAQIATDGGFTTLLAAVEAAGLTSALADCAADPITVFAPTDEAFAALPEGVLDAALADPEGLLTTVLTYHLLGGYVGAAEVTTSESLTPLQGETISVEGAILNGSINITATNNWGCNGVVHVIDAVLLPPSLTEAPETTVAPTTTIADVLPETGTESWMMALVAGLLVLAGFAMLGVRRRAA